MTLVLAIPGVAYVLTPVLRKRAGVSGPDEGFVELARLSELEPEKPRSYTVMSERWDSWVKYPREPVGSVWLVRQPAGSSTPVVAFTSECPHLGCSVNLGPGGEGFHCPCHNSAFKLDGTPMNAIPPRPMDTLEVRLSNDEDPRVRVKFERFRTMAKEKVPLA